MPAAVMSSGSPIINLRKIEVSSFSASLADVSLGEILSATVLEKSAGGKCLLALKNTYVPAASTLPLKIGETLIVKVGSLQPQIVLTVVDEPTQRGEAIVKERLQQWRANPESLIQVINKVAEFAVLAKTDGLSLKVSSGDIDKLIKIFESIVFSSRTKEDPLFLPKFISNTGLLLESTLRQLIAQSVRGQQAVPLEDNLKTLLLKLSAAVGEALRENSSADSPTVAKLMNIAEFADEALQTIETRQVLNTIYQESENGFALQIPIALGGSFRLADIFITHEEKKEQGKKKFSAGSIVIFLDLDVLGKLMINASVREGGFSCVIKCAREEVRDLITGGLEEWRRLLTATGYSVNYLDCIQEEELESQREEFLAGQSFSAIDLVNFFI
jgi:hypothetical protein